MRKTLIIAALISCSIASKAQKIELGLNGGVVPHSGENGLRLAYYGSPKAALDKQGWQAGIAAEVMHARSTRKIRMTSTSNPADDNIFKVQNQATHIIPNAFVNKKLNIKKGHLYAGVSVGWDFATLENRTDGAVTNSSKFSDFMGGVQLGYTGYVTERLGINAEAAGRWVNYRRGAFVFPISVGVRYRL